VRVIILRRKRRSILPILLQMSFLSHLIMFLAASTRAHAPAAAPGKGTAPLVPAT